MLRFRSVLLSFIAAMLLLSPAGAQVPAPLVDDGVFSFAVDVRVKRESVAVTNVYIVPGSARSYGRHQDEFRVVAISERGRPLIQIATFDPRWQRVYDWTPAGEPPLSSNPVQSREHLIRDQSIHEQTLPADPPIERNQTREHQMRDSPTHITGPLNNPDLIPPSPGVKEERRRVSDATLRYFLPFRADVRAIFAGYPAGPRSKSFDVSKAVEKFCKSNPKVCRHQR